MALVHSLQGKGDVHPRPLQVVVGAVEDGVQLSVANVHILGVQRVALPLPRHGVVVAADGHTVVAQREDLVFRADDAGPHLTAGVFGAHRREQGNAHEVFVPVDIIRAFHRAVLLRLRESWSRRPYYSVPQGLLQ